MNAGEDEMDAKVIPMKQEEDDLEESDLIDTVVELDSELNLIDEEISARIEDEKIGDWTYISELLETFRLMNSSLSRTAVLEHVIDAAISVIKAERGFLLLKNDNGGMDFKIARDAEKNQLTDKAFKVSQSVLQDAIANNRIAYIEDTLSENAFTPSQSIQQLRLRSIVCCPMMADGELVGVIYADSSKPLIGRSQAKKQLFQLFANQAAVAIRNSQLYHRVRKSYERLENAQEKLIYAEKMAARGQMAARIGHELNNQLMGASGNLDLAITLMERGDCQIEKILEKLKRVTSIIMGMERFSNGLMAHTHLKTKLDRSKLNEIIHEFVEFIRPVFGKTGATFVECFNSEIDVNVDRGQIQQVLYNLVKNAIEARPDAKVVFETKLLPQGDGVELRIEDNGPGIEKEKLDQIFLPLFSEKTNGHGYGLSICKEILKKHRGSISVQSAVGKGTTFIITLPTSFYNNLPESR